MRRLLQTIFATSLMISFAPTAAAQTKGWTDASKTRKPGMSSLVPRMSSDEAYSERYGFAVDLDGGGHVGIDFTISNLGWGDHNGAAAVRVRLPGEKNYDFSSKVSDDEWTHAKKGFALDIAKTTVRGKGNGKFELKHDGDVKVELTFQNTIPMWRPGNGQITVDGGYYAFDLIAPRANVSGRVKVGGEWHDVKGTRAGYADHVATNVAPFDLGKRFVRFRHYNKDVFVIWREILLTEEHGGKSFTWVMVGYKDDIVFEDADADLKFAKTRKDGKTGYRVPRAVQIDARKGKDKIRFVMRGSKMKRSDLLASYGKAAKLVASAVSEPYRYDLKGNYQLQMTIGGASATISGRSHYTIDYVNH